MILDGTTSIFAEHGCLCLRSSQPHLNVDQRMDCSRKLVSC
jgi:hypothetical protein